MMLPKVFLTQRIQEAGMSILEGSVDYTLWSEDGPHDIEQIERDIPNADGILVTGGLNLDEKFFSLAPKLKVASLYSVGYDNVDLAAATKHGVIITNTPGVLTDATANTALMLMLMAARCARENDIILRGGGWTHWSPRQFVGADIYGAVLGIVGMGEIGRAVAKRARGFGMKIIYTGRGRKLQDEECGAEYRTLDELLAESDFVSLNCSLNEETNGLIGERELMKMKQSAILINTARGQVVDQQALYRACREGWIYAAGLDVFEKEPLPLDEPLLTLGNVITMPHIGSAEKSSRDGMARLSAQNLVDALSGREPKHVVNRELLERSGRGN